MIIYKTTNLMTGDFYIGKDSKNNAVFANCIEHLLRGGDIYKIFEQIIVMQTKTQEKLSELIKSGTLRQEIIVSKEKFDELTSGL